MMVRQRVIDRDHGKCVKCGRVVWNAIPVAQYSIHHRVPRGMGGANRGLAEDMSNLVLLCGTGTTGCHGWVESNRRKAREEGWLVSRHADPSEVPVSYWDGNQYLLGSDGTRCVG